MAADSPTPYTVLFDGWSLAYRPASPQALHLLAILERMPDQARPVVALPKEPPEWFPPVPAHAPRAAKGEVSLLAWEQGSMPRLAHRLHADLLHLTSPNAPVFSGVPQIFSPCGFSEEEPAGPSPGRLTLRHRLRDSLGRGGLARARAVLWPDDLPAGAHVVPRVNLPPVVYSAFGPSEEPGMADEGNGSHRTQEELDRLGLPETYILYHGPAHSAPLRRLLGAWRWAANAIGLYHPLIILGFNAQERDLFYALMAQDDYGETLRLLPEVSPAAIAALYRGCRALFHPAPEPPWGGPIRQALACGKPVVAIEHPSIGKMVGPAAYLAPPEDERALGAALITVVVEDEMATGLAEAARQRAAAWSGSAYTRALSALYQRMLH